MRWSQTSIQTLREDVHAPLMRAGYAKVSPSTLPELLFLGERTVNKIRAAFESQGDWATVLKASGIEAIQAGDHFVALSDSGKETLVVGAQYAALKERAVTIPVPAAHCDPHGDHHPAMFGTPDVKTIAQLVEFTGQPATSQLKSVVMWTGGKLILILLRGDHQLSETKLADFLKADDLRPATAEEIKEEFGADPGSLGPIGVDVRIIADEALRGRRNMIAGANRTGYHMSDVSPGEDFRCDYVDLRLATPHDRCITDEGPLHFLTAALVDTPDQALLIAAEQNVDSDGLCLPAGIAPFQVVISPVHPSQLEPAEAMYQDLQAAGIDVLLDDRDVRPGVKFKDADLIGFPLRINVGKKMAEGRVELVERKGRSMSEVLVADLLDAVKQRLADALPL
jgi:prolyl-tRNA synthetase